jgi:hypothetical protein
MELAYQMVLAATSRSILFRAARNRESVSRNSEGLAASRVIPAASVVESRVRETFAILDTVTEALRNFQRVRSRAPGRAADASL